MGVKFFKNVNQNVIRKVDEVAKQSNVVIFDNQHTVIKRCEYL